MQDDNPEEAFRPTRLKNESAAYVARREELRLAEIESMRLREQVADLPRRLPEGAAVEDYVFAEGPTDLHAGDIPVRTVRLSDLFSAPGRALVVYHFMYGKRQARACPMCTLWIDGFNGVAHHLAQNVDLVIVAAADPSMLRDHARKRSWNRLRLLSAVDGSTFKYDLGSEDRDGHQTSTLRSTTDQRKRNSGRRHDAPIALHSTDCFADYFNSA